MKKIYLLPFILVAGCLNFENINYRHICDRYNPMCVDRALSEPDNAMQVLGAVLSPGTALAPTLEREVGRIIAATIKKVIGSAGGKVSVTSSQALSTEAARDVAHIINLFTSSLGREVTQLEQQAALAAWKKEQELVLDTADNILRANQEVIDLLLKNRGLNLSDKLKQKLRKIFPQVVKSKEKAAAYMQSTPELASPEFLQKCNDLWASYFNLENLIQDALRFSLN